MSIFNRQQPPAQQQMPPQQMPPAQQAPAPQAYLPPQQPYQPPAQQPVQQHYPPVGGQGSPAPIQQPYPQQQPYVPPAPANPYAPQGQPAYPPQQPYPPQGHFQGQPRSMFKNLRDARPMVDANYVRSGQYWLKINRVKVDTSRKGDEFVAIEMTIIRVITNPGIPTAPDLHHVGEEVTHMLMKKSDYFDSELLGFFTGVLGLAKEQITPEIENAITGPQNAAGNIVIEMDNRNISTRPSAKNPQGGIFTKKKYVREVPPAEALQFLQQTNPQAIPVWFPGGYLERMAAGGQ